MLQTKIDTTSTHSAESTSLLRQRGEAMRRANPLVCALGQAQMDILIATGDLVAALRALEIPPHPITDPLNEAIRQAVDRIEKASESRAARLALL